ncbi:hypothetical protein K438DRAFT_1774154 [Mycena galopus ATCC 62051]|nr:hypothetical protein K438DRAFT_1774154 [Mycena galopus ATCC 62051]
MGEVTVVTTAKTLGLQQRRRGTAEASYAEAEHHEFMAMRAIRRRKQNPKSNRIDIGGSGDGRTSSVHLGDVRVLRPWVLLAALAVGGVKSRWQREESRRAYSMSTLCVVSMWVPRGLRAELAYVFRAPRLLWPRPHMRRFRATRPRTRAPENVGLGEVGNKEMTEMEWNEGREGGILEAEDKLDMHLAPCALHPAIHPTPSVFTSPSFSLDTFVFPIDQRERARWREQGWVGLKRRARRWQSVKLPKRRYTRACGPGQTPHDVSQVDNRASVHCSYSGFTDFKGVVLNATIAFLTAPSGKQISKKQLMDEGIAPPEAVQDLDEAVVIANYRARIDTAIPLLRSWLNTKPNPPPQDPILKIFGGLGSQFDASSNLGRLLDQRALIAEIMAKIPIDFNVVNPRNLDAKEVERLLRMVRPYCEWDEKSWGAPPPPEYQPPRVRVPVADNESPDETDGAGGESAQVEEDGRGDEVEDKDEDEDDEIEDEDEQHFIDEMITVFGAVPPGGTART